MADSIWWQALNIDDLLYVSSILLRAFQATGINRLKAIKIPHKIFTEEKFYFYYPLIEQLERNLNCFEIINNREEIQEFFVSQGVNNNDYQSNIILRITNKSVIETLREFIAELESERVERPESHADITKLKSGKNLQNFIDPDKSKWHVDINDSKGTYDISTEKKLEFHGGRFGGINELINNSGGKLRKDQLIKAIKGHIQKGNGENIKITQWKYELEHETEFAKYFFLDNKEKNYCRLYLRAKPDT